MSENADTPRLSCLGAVAIPDGLADDIQLLGEMPSAALENFWAVLGPTLGSTVTAQVEAKLDTFCRSFSVSDVELAKTIKAFRFILRKAAQNDITKEQFAEDLRILTEGDDDAPVNQVLLAGFDQAKQAIRQEILRLSVAEHGHLLVGVDWRLETITASQHTDRMRVGLGMLTLRFQEGDRVERITLQALPDMLHILRDACDQLLKE